MTKRQPRLGARAKTYKPNRRMADRVRPAMMKFLVGHAHLMGFKRGAKARVATDIEDMRHNTDVVLYDGNRWAPVSLRVRRPKWRRHRGQFTIERLQWERVLEGRGRYDLYCFLGATEEEPESWLLVDMEPIRKAGPGLWAKVIVEEKLNRENGCEFLVFSIARLRRLIPEAVLACKANEARRRVRRAA